MRTSFRLIATNALIILAFATTHATSKLFPTDLPETEWVTFQAQSYSSPVSGVIYRTAKPPVAGVPLGGVETGCIAIEPTGIWGYRSIFNANAQFTYNPKWRMPRKIPSHIDPLLGLAVGNQTWVLVPEKFMNGSLITWNMEPHMPGVWVKESKVEKIQAPMIEGVKPAKEIHYWGHYPVADVEYETDAPLQVGLRAWSPFFPGDAAASDIPAAIFEVHLRNPSAHAQTGAIALHFPGPDPDEAKSTEFLRRQVDGQFRGILVSSPAEVSYALGVIGEKDVRLGAGLQSAPEGWSNLATRLPEPNPRDSNGLEYYKDPSSSAAVDFTLDPNQEKIVRFVLAWYAPLWEGADRKQEGAQPKKEWKAPSWLGEQLHYTHMYAARYNSAIDVAQRVAADHEELLHRIVAWQTVLYSEEGLPVWLRDALINNLHLIAASGYWAQPKSPLGDWAFPTGVFAMNESSRGCPHTSCIPCDWYGGLPITYFFPELARSTLRAFKQYQRLDGEIPFALGQIGDLPDMASPEFFWQKSLNGTCFIDMVDRLWQRTGDDSILREFYESAKRVNTYTMNLSTKPGRIIRMPDDGGMEWFEHGEWAGMATHMGGLHLAQLRMIERMARHTRDEAYAKQCHAWLAEGQKDMEEKMWAGSYYLNFWDPEANKKSGDVMGYQLDGEWAAHFHGLDGVFRPERVKTTLQTIKRCNIALTPNIGAANFTHPDGTPIEKKVKGPETSHEKTEDVAHYGTHSMFVAEVPVLGMTYMCAGEREFGLELVRKHWANLVCRQGLTWDMPNMVNGLTGERLFGTDYYQAMMLWAVPASTLDKDIKSFCAPGALVDRIIKAAQAPAREGQLSDR